MPDFNYEQWLRDNYAGWGAELEAATEGQTTAEDAVGDVADGVLCSPDGKQVAAYLKSRGVRDVKGRLADDLYEIAHDEG